jgi:hypothetical protein
MTRQKLLQVKKMTRLESRAWDILAERVAQGKECAWIIAYAAACAEANRKQGSRKRSKK